MAVKLSGFGILIPLASAQHFDRLRALGRRPAVPRGLRLYVVGDIHGRCDLLDKLLRRIEADLTDRPVIRSVHVFLGDYIDRGPQSRETIDRLLQLNAMRECIFLKGNHELIALKCLTERGLFAQWARLGGVETLRSYGISVQMLEREKQIIELQAAFHDALPANHFRFFRDLQLRFTCGDFFFAHAGIRPDVDLKRQHEHDLLWIRDKFLSSPMNFGKIIVHGHTPVRAVEVHSNRINIDTGAFATGRLSCLVIEDTTLSIIDTH